MSNTIDASMLELNRCWEALYVGIERANMLLANLHKAAVSDSARNEVKRAGAVLKGLLLFCAGR